MKRFIILFLFLLAALTAQAQAVRIDPQPTTTVAGNVPGGAMTPLLAIPGASIHVCASPANAVPCTNYATTYTDLSANTTCPSSAQVTLPGANACVPTSDSQGNFGFWMISGTYEYTITLPYSNVSYGPYPITVPGNIVSAATYGVNCAGGDSTSALTTMAAAAANKTVYFTSGCIANLNANLTIPSNINLQFQQNSGISVVSGFTLTIASATTPASNFQIFYGSGTAKFTNLYQVLPEWWGAAMNNSTDDTAAIQKALNNVPLLGTVYISGLTKISSALIISQSEKLVCATNSLSHTAINGTNAAADLISLQTPNGSVVEIHCDLGGVSHDTVHFQFGGATDQGYLDRHSSFSGYWTGYTFAGLEASDNSAFENTIVGPIDFRGGTGAQYGLYVVGDQSVSAVQFLHIHSVGNAIAGVYIEQSQTSAEMDSVEFLGLKPEGNSGTGLTLKGGVQANVYDAHFEQNGLNNPGIPDISIAGGAASVTYLNMYGGIIGVTGASQGNTRIKAEAGGTIKMNFMNVNFYRSGTDIIDGNGQHPVITYFGNSGRPKIINGAQQSGPSFTPTLNSGNTGSYAVGNYESVVLCNATSANPETITLPTVASYPNREVTVSKGDGSFRTCTVTTADGSTIAGSASDTFNVPYMSRTYFNDGTNWYRENFENPGGLAYGTGAQLTITAGVIVPTNKAHHVTGAVTLTTITTPSGLLDGEDFYAIADTAFTVSSAGNILVTSTYTVPNTNFGVHFRWSNLDNKWYIVQ